MIRRLLRALARKGKRRYYADASKSIGASLRRDDYQENLCLSFFDADTGRNITVLFPPVHWTALARVTSQMAAFRRLREERTHGRHVLFDDLAAQDEA